MDAKRLESSFIEYLRWHSPVSATLRGLGILEQIPAGALGEGLDAYCGQSVTELSSDLHVKIRDLSPQVLRVTEFSATQGERFARELATARDSVSTLIETDRQLAQEVGNLYLYEWGLPLDHPHLIGQQNSILLGHKSLFCYFITQFDELSNKPLLTFNLSL